MLKFNKKGKAKDIILRIDGFNISHKKVNEKEGFFSSLIPDAILKNSRNKQKPLSTVARFYRVNPIEFKIYFSDSKKETKYRTQTPDDCSNIIAKLRFLTQAISNNK